MKWATLPQVCCRCRALKLPELGRFFRHRTYSQWLWVCKSCDGHQEIKTLTGHRLSPPELRVKTLLSTFHHPVFSEYTLGPFTFDFSIPRLRLLIEVNSKTYHKSKFNKRRDQNKEAYAKQNSWLLITTSPSPAMLTQVAIAVAERARHLGL